MDWVEPTQTVLAVRPRGAARESAPGDPGNLSWVSDFGSVVALMYGKIAVDGLNERGFQVSGLYLAESDYGSRDTERPGLMLHQAVQLLLDRFDTVASAAQWLTGGAMGLVVALWFEPVSALAQVSATSWVAWAYLLVFGTLVALNAYLWLLQNTSAALAGSYSFVNPAVALCVGVALGGERLTGWVFAALPLIGGALVLILYGPALQRRWGGAWSAGGEPRQRSDFSQPARQP